MTIISIANRKGGTGKTTTALNLGAEEAARGKKTLLIDLDTQGHLAWGLGFKGEKDFPVYIHKLFEDKNFDLKDAVYETSFENLYLAPSDVNFINNPQKKIEVDLLKRSLDKYIKENNIDMVIIDTPPTLDIFMLSALVASDVVLIPFLPHFLAAVGVKQMAKLFYKVAVKYNTNLRLLGLVPVMVNKRIGMHKKVIEELTKVFGKNRMLRGIRTNVKLAEAFLAGIPVRYYAPKSAGSMDYYLLTEEIHLLIGEK
ncbi:ParA family protein [Desulfothermus naphthae]